MSMSLTAKFTRSYLSKATGERRAIYTVNGPSKELEAYKAFQGSYAMDNDGKNVIIFADAPLNRHQVYNVIFSEELQRYYVDFSHLNDANATVATAKKRLTEELASEIIKMEAIELRGNPRTTSLTSSATPAESTAEAEETASADFDAEIEEASEESPF